MAKDKKALTRLIPHNVITKDGVEVMVPTGQAENSMANKFLASQMRHMLHEQIKKYNDGEIRLTPKELKDLTEAARNVAEFSGVVYKESDEIDHLAPPKAGEKPAEAEEIDLGTIGEKTITTTDGNSTSEGDSRPDSDQG